MTNKNNDSHGSTPPPGPPAAGELPPVETLRPVAYLEIKAAALLLFTLALIVGSGLYLLYARGAFEPTQTLILTADDSEGVVVGMDMTFSGFPIGRVRRIELADEGNARILVDVPARTPTGCASRACSRWCVALWAAPISAPIPAC